MTFVEGSLCFVETIRLDYPKAVDAPCIGVKCILTGFKSKNKEKCFFLCFVLAFS